MVAFYHITSTVIINLEDYVQEDRYCKMKHHFWDYLLWTPAQAYQAVNKKNQNFKTNALVNLHKKLTIYNLTIKPLNLQFNHI